MNLDDIQFYVSLINWQWHKLWSYLVKKMSRPKCGCGNTQNSQGYCDGSHANKQNKVHWKKL